jgi:hypothetical protein
VLVAVAGCLSMILLDQTALALAALTPFALRRHVEEDGADGSTAAPIA